MKNKYTEVTIETHDNWKAKYVSIDSLIEILETFCEDDEFVEFIKIRFNKN